MSKLTGIALKRARLVPSAMFASPAAVVRSQALSLAQKIAVLRRWEFDLRQHGKADRAAAVGGDLCLLEEVHRALAELGVSGTPPQSQIRRVPAATH